MSVYSQGDPRQKIQICNRCGDATERCEEDEIICDDCDDGPLCLPCWHNDPHYDAAAPVSPAKGEAK